VIAAKREFVAAGGNGTRFDQAIEAGAAARGAERMKSCITEQAANVAKNVDSATAQELNSWRSKCAAIAKEQFMAAGGAKDAFERSIREGAKQLSADKMKTCIKDKANTAGKDIDTATKSEMTTWQTACRALAVKALQAAGGDSSEFIRGIKDNAAANGAARMRACMLNAAAADGKDFSAATAEEKETYSAACMKAAEAEFQASGGEAGNFALAQQLGALRTGSDKLKSCFDDKVKSSGKSFSAATADEKRQWQLACGSDAKTEFEVAGGDASKWAESKARGARQKMAEAMENCIDDKVAAASKTWDTATSEEKKTWTAACEASVRQEFAAAGGKDENVRTAKLDGAVERGGDEFQACIVQQASQDTPSVAEDDIPDALDTLKKKWMDACKAQARVKFEKAGGDGAIFEAALAQDRQAKVAEAISACGSSTEKAACVQRAQKMAKSLGGKPERLGREVQEGARKMASQSIRACTDQGASKEDCIAAAKAAYTEVTGRGSDATEFAKEVRRGAGSEAATELRTCLADAGTNKSAMGSCITDACATHASSGGDGTDCWFDRKRGLMRWALQNYKSCVDAGVKDEATCNTEAKTFFIDTLKGEESDWNAEDWEAMKTHSDAVSEVNDAAAVDIRLQDSGSDSAAVKSNLDSKKTAIQEAIKGALSAQSVTCGAASDAVSTTDASIGCRAVTSDASTAKSATTTVRGGDLTTPVNNALTRRLQGVSRRLAIADSDSSQVQVEGAAPTTTAGPTTTATVAGGSTTTAAGQGATSTAGQGATSTVASNGGTQPAGQTSTTTDIAQSSGASDISTNIAIAAAAVALSLSVV
jgi:hypothetical protein